MKNKPYYFVFSSPYDQEENDFKSCYILVMIPYTKIADFADYLEANTALSVDAYVKHDHFFTTIGEYFLCTVLEVHIKEDEANLNMSCEEVAQQETVKYLTDHGYRTEVPW